MKKSLLILLTIFLAAPLAKAAHVVGGDITVTWVSQNQYNVQLQFYRDNLGGGSTMPGSVDVGIYEVGTNNLLTTLTLQQTSIGFVALGDGGCFIVDPTNLQIEKGTFQTSTPVNIPDFAAGYYLQFQTWARNALSVNLTNPGGTGISFFAMIPDPALGQNSTPQFDIYPPDSYFCTNTTKIFNLNVTDSDGDSLVYSLVTPLDGVGTGTGTNAGTGAYPYYAPVTWNAGGGYSLANILGGAPPMSVDNLTGDITGNAPIADYFTFALRVEEFRSGVKIGEIRRDIQYLGLNCTLGSLPTFIDPTLSEGDTINIDYNRQYCRDFVMVDVDVDDTLYMELISPIFDSGAIHVDKVPDMSGNISFYTNWNGTTFLDTTVTDTNWFDPISGLEFNEGTIGQRFCYTPGCSQVDEVYPFEVQVSSAGCDGLFIDTLSFFIKVVPATANLTFVAAKSIPYGDEYCKSIIFEDTSLVDLLDIVLYSDIFDEGGEIPDLDNSYVYTSFEHPNSVVTGVPNDAQNTQYLATQFCWTPDCQHIGSTYNMKAVLSSVDCPTAFKEDTISFDFLITPPFDSLDVVPNIFTPNGDGVNDVYRIGGVSNPCNDAIKVQIFSRWGTLVFESEVPTFEWDGTNKGGGDAPAGTYFVLVSGIYGSETVTLDQRTVSILR